MRTATLMRTEKTTLIQTYCLSLVAILIPLVCAGFCRAADNPADAPAGAKEEKKPAPPLREPNEPSVAEASSDGQNAIANIKYPGLSCELFAAEPDVANIIAFHPRQDDTSECSPRGPEPFVPQALRPTSKYEPDCPRCPCPVERSRKQTCVLGSRGETR